MKVLVNLNVQYKLLTTTDRNVFPALFLHTGIKITRDVKDVQRTPIIIQMKETVLGVEKDSSWMWKHISVWRLSLLHQIVLHQLHSSMEKSVLFVTSLNSGITMKRDASHAQIMNIMTSMKSSALNVLQVSSLISTPILVIRSKKKIWNHMKYQILSNLQLLNLHQLNQYLSKQQLHPQ